jgi:hypothetical protein
MRATPTAKCDINSVKKGAARYNEGIRTRRGQIVMGHDDDNNVDREEDVVDHPPIAMTKMTTRLWGGGLIVVSSPD